MQGVLEEAAFRTNEQMSEESSEVLSELADVKDFHLEGHIQYLGPLLDEDRWASKSAEPSGHEASAAEDFVAPD